MPNLYKNPPAAESQYHDEPGFRPKRTMPHRNPWMVALVMAVLVALINSILLWHTDTTRDGSTAPQPPGESTQPSAQPAPAPSAR